MSIIETIQKFVPIDTQLTELFERVQEYAELYLIAKQRQKGCDGMGEVATLKDELIYYLNKMIRYCKEKGYLSGDVSYDIDLIAHDICETKPK
ncbi:MAG: hypothetical protein A2Z47_08265 [Thermodesulfovibrio sp. RBG_19FT_COMBO_42_12]|nr:MAG: hypothetical protein A2Z47_08265 [Thermodesulfovibrio sp. RBG_19FT_COMBO_42_12]